MQTTDICVVVLFCRRMAQLAREVWVADLLKRGSIKLVAGALSIGLAACSSLPPQSSQPAQDRNLVLNDVDRAISEAAQRVSNAGIRAQLEVLKNRGSAAEKADFISGARKYRDIAGGGETYTLPNDLEVFLHPAAPEGLAVTASCLDSPPSCVYAPVCTKYSTAECVQTLYHKLCTQPSDSCFDNPGRSRHQQMTLD